MIMVIEIMTIANNGSNSRMARMIPNKNVNNTKT